MHNYIFRTIVVIIVPLVEVLLCTAFMKGTFHVSKVNAEQPEEAVYPTPSLRAPPLPTWMMAHVLCACSGTPQK